LQLSLTQDFGLTGVSAIKNYTGDRNVLRLNFGAFQVKHFFELEALLLDTYFFLQADYF